MNRLLALALCCSTAALALNPAQVPRTRAPTTPTAAPTHIKSPATALTSVQRNYANDLPRMIRQAQQVVLYAPRIVRADIPEAIRLSMNERGTSTLLLTTFDSLMTPNSYTFRLQLMGNPTYSVSGAGEPFIVLDGVAYTGAGIVNVGPVYQASKGRSAELIGWAQQIINTQKPLDTEDTLKKWTKKNLNITLN